MELSSANNYAPSSAAARPLDRVSAADMPSPLLLKRLQQQKKKIAEAKAEAKKGNSLSVSERTQQWTGEQQTPRTPEGIAPKSIRQYSLPGLGSSEKSNRRVRGVGGRVEGMGVREMDQFISNLKKENFDLKLNLYHLREKGSKTETELSYLRAQLTRANARADELTHENDRLHEALQEREHALTKAVEMIASFQDRFTEHESTCNGLLNKQPEFSEQGTMTDEMASPNSGSTLKPQNSVSFGISPFTYRNSSPSLVTPFRVGFCQSRDVFGSPCPSTNSNLIDLDTPRSVVCSDTSLLGSVFLSDDKGHTSIRTSLAPYEFVNRCTSVTSEGPAGGDGPPSPTHSMVSALDSPQLSMLSETSFASMYRSHNNSSQAYSEDNSPSTSNCNEYLQVMDGPTNLSKKWGLTRVQKLVDAFTPSRRASPTRRVSPRREIMEFKDKQEKQRDRMSRDLETGRGTMPPTPESISPRETGDFNSSEDCDNDDDANCCMSMVSPTEMDEQTKATSVDEDVCRPMANALEMSLISESDVEIAGPRLNQQRNFKFQSGQTTTAAQKEQAFGDITNMRDTHKRLGYGFGDRLGNRSHTSSSRKHVGRDLTYSIRKHVSAHNPSKKDNIVTIPVRAVVARGLPVRTPTLTTPPVEYNLNTPPYTPNSADAISMRRLARQKSWESFNSGSNSNSDRADSQQQIKPHVIGSINASTLKRRNSAATVTATKLSVTLNRGLNEPVVNMRRQSGIPTPEVRRQSGIPSLVRSSSLNVGAKERSRCEV